MRYKQVVVLIVTVLCMIGLFAGPSFGQTEMPLPPVEEKLDFGIEALQLIAFYDTQIYQVGSEARVKLEGYTITQTGVDYIAARVKLQKWNGYDWIDVTSNLFADYNTDYVDGAYYYNVQRGYYYRAAGIHLATDGNIDEQTESHSASIFVQ